MTKIKLMSHLVAGYPTDELALTAARALVAGGADILEVQLPFSDPSADGPAIQSACTEVLARGYRTEDGLHFIKTLRTEFPGVPIYIMSYASLVYTPGVGTFCKQAALADASGMIVPDLPFDNDEGLFAACRENGMEAIPVAAPSMDASRLKKLADAGFTYIYATLRAGITGTDTAIDSHTLAFLKSVSAGGSKVYAGFGITSGEQSKALAASVDAVVAGSVFVRLIAKHKDNATALSRLITEKAQEITCSRQ